MSEQKWAAGDKCWLIDGGRYGGPSRRFPGEHQVIKVNRTTATLQGPSGRVLAHLTLMSRTPLTMADVADVEIRGEVYVQGTVVRWPGAPAAHGTTLYVVIKDDGTDLIQRMVPLGNATGRYVRRVRAADVTRVDLAEILRDDAR
jgi:hypothetical protein